MTSDAQEAAAWRRRKAAEDAEEQQKEREKRRENTNENAHERQFFQAYEEVAQDRERKQAAQQRRTAEGPAGDTNESGSFEANRQQSQDRDQEQTPEDGIQAAELARDRAAVQDANTGQPGNETFDNWLSRIESKDAEADKATPDTETDNDCQQSQRSPEYDRDIDVA